MTLRTSAHSVARLHAAVAMAALSTFRSPHAAQEVGLASAGRTLQTTAKKGFTGTREHGVSKKLGGEGKAMAKKDGSNDNGHHGTLRVAHGTTVQRKHMDGAGVRRATANGGWTRHAA